jgi:hypothetical protein
MPFTFSHPAIILPEKYYCFSALIAGSITPDFEYFIRMKDYSKYSHTLPGAVWFDIPLGLILLFIFHNLIRNILIEHLPFSLNIRFSEFEEFNWNKYFTNNILVVLISLFIGIASHLFWDSFTHDGEYFSRTIPFLKESYYILNHTISGAEIFQYVGSLIGGIIILLFIAKMPEGRNTKQKNILPFWLYVSIMMVIVLNLRVCLDYILNHHQHEDIIVTSISGALIGITVLSLYLKEKNKREIDKKIYKIRSKIN